MVLCEDKLQPTWTVMMPLYRLQNIDVQPLLLTIHLHISTKKSCFQKKKIFKCILSLNPNLIFFAATFHHMINKNVNKHFDVTTGHLHIYIQRFSFTNFTV